MKKAITRLLNFYLHFYKRHYVYVETAGVIASFQREKAHHRVENCPLCPGFIIRRISFFPNIDVISGKVGQPWTE